MASSETNSIMKPFAWCALVGLALLLFFSSRLSVSRPTTAADRVIRDAALSVEEASLSRLDAGEAPAVVRKQLLAIKQRENEEWTERNIRRNPVLYLEHCKTMLQSLREDLLDAQFGARVEQTRFQRLIKEDKLAMDTGRAFIAEAESLFGGVISFPVQIGGVSYSGETFTNAVLDADASVTRAEKAISIHETSAKKAEELALFLTGTIAGLDEELEAIPLEIEALKAQEAQKAAKETRSRIANLLDGVHELSRSTAISPTPSHARQTSLHDIFTRNHKTEKESSK